MTHLIEQFGAPACMCVCVCLCVCVCVCEKAFQCPETNNKQNQRAYGIAETMAVLPELRVCVCVCVQSSSCVFAPPLTESQLFTCSPTVQVCFMAGTWPPGITIFLAASMCVCVCLCVFACVYVCVSVSPRAAAVMTPSICCSGAEWSGAGRSGAWVGVDYAISVCACVLYRGGQSWFSL